MKRRQFIKTGTIAATATTLFSNMAYAAKLTSGNRDKWGAIMPQRPLGKTGEGITIMGPGGAHMTYMEEKGVEPLIEKCMESGIRFYDTANVYGKGRSEELYGKYLIPKYRDEIFIMTKSHAKDATTLNEHIHTSLKRMKTDRLDLVMIHMLEDKNDVDTRESGGVYDALRKFQSEGIIRHLGFSCHTNASAALYFLEKIKDDDFICAGLYPVNPVDATNPDNSFSTMVLPEMAKRGHSNFAMKTMGGGGLLGTSTVNRPDGPRPEKKAIPDHISVEENIHFVLSQPVTSWISGMLNLEHFKENFGFTKGFQKISKQQKEDILRRVTGLYTDNKVESYKKEV